MFLGVLKQKIIGISTIYLCSVAFLALVWPLQIYISMQAGTYDSFSKQEVNAMSYFFHPNQLQCMLAEQDNYDDNLDMRSISRALRFWEGIDDEEEPLRLRHRRRVQRDSEACNV